MKFKIKGIQLKIHPTFLALVVLLGVSGLAAKGLLVFTLVILHEIAHTLAARSYGVKIHSVELYPYGGTAVLEDTFEGKGREETVIAFAGPALNLSLFLLLTLLHWEGLLAGVWVEEVIQINFWLFAFNLLPVLPLDGGRIARSLLANTFGFVPTTRFFAVAGRYLGALFAVFGLLLLGLGFFQYEPGLFLILGIFFWLGSGKEERNAQVVFLKQLCRKKERLLKEGLMRTRMVTVSKGTPLRQIIGTFSTDEYSLVGLVGVKNQLEKTFSETEILEAMFQYGWEIEVGRLVAAD